METLLLVAERDGSEMMARIGMTQALNRHSAKADSAPRRKRALKTGLISCRGGSAMCEAGKEIDAKIEHYERVARKITDQETIDGLNKLVADMKRKKAKLHPEKQSPSERG
jgi:hypothetical protein